MIILGIESSSTAASCAVMKNRHLLGEFTLNHKLTHSEKLMPLIVDLLTSLDLKPLDLNLIAINEGPGSYTGLRIGGAIAKGIGFVGNQNIASISATSALAYNIKYIQNPIIPLIDARGDRVYHATYQWNNNEFIELASPDMSHISSLIEELSTKHSQPFFVGDGAKKHQNLIESLYLNRGVPRFTDSTYEDVIKAHAICELGYQAYLQGKSTSIESFAPNYIRPSQAERNKTNVP